MSVIDKEKTYKNLLRKGFSAKEGDHKYLEFWYEKRLILQTKVSHGSKTDLDNYLIGQMSRQCKLNKNQFINLAKCPMSEEEYIELLKNQKLID